MNAFNAVFDPLDLEISDRVYEAALAQFEAHRPLTGGDRDEELKDGFQPLCL